MIQIITHPQNVTVNAGALVTLSVSASADAADGALSYKWQRADSTTPTEFVDIPGAAQSVYQIAATALSDSGDVFRCVVSAANVSTPVLSNTATLTVQPAVLSINLQPQSLTTDPRNNVLFTVGAQIVPASTIGYQWQYSSDNVSWANIPLATSSSYAVNFVTYSNKGWYRCALSSPLALNSPLYSSSARLDVTPAEMSIITQPVSTQGFVTQRIPISVEAGISFSQVITYQWQYSTTGTRNWIPLDNSNSATYAIIDADVEDTGYYRCVLSNANSTVTSLTTTVIQVSVKKPTITITSNPLSQSTILTLQSAFSVSASIDFVGQRIDYAWQYSTDSVSWNDVPGQTSNIFRLTSTSFADAGYYRCAIKNFLAKISPVYSSVVTLEVTKPTLQITSQPVNQTAYLTKNVDFSVNASIEGTNVIGYQWQFSQNGSSNWADIPDQTLRTLTIDELVSSQIGFYRCAVSNPNATVPVIYSNVVELIGLTPGIDILDSNVESITIDYEDEVEFDVSATSLILINYQWQRRASVSSSWENIVGQISPSYRFTPDVLFNGYQYRCQLSNRAGVLLYSSVATLTINPFFYISSQPQAEVNVRRSLSKTIKLITLARSTNQAQLSYQWKVLNELTSIWGNVPGATSSTLVLNVTSIEGVSTRYRCSVSFNASTINSSESVVVLRNDLNLYFKGCFNGTTGGQDEAIEELDVVGSVVDKSCSRESLNTCGYTLAKAFKDYPIYNSQKGLYKSWGDVIFKWEAGLSTNNLLFSANDNKWSISTFREITSYNPGDRVIYLEDDGYTVSIYEALVPILSFPGAFDLAKWKKVCYIESTTPAGLPSVAELYERYSLYNLEFFYKEWDDVNVPWDEDLREQSVDFCLGLNPTATFTQLEKCIDDRKLSTDMWRKAKVRKEFFYRAGDVVLIEGECKDIVCAYIAKQDMPASEALYAEYQDFKLGVYWQKLYCLATGQNKCLEYQRVRDVHAGYDVVELGSKGHFVEVPVPYRLRPTPETLDRRAMATGQPVVLTQAQIDALNQPQED